MLEDSCDDKKVKDGSINLSDITKKFEKPGQGVITAIDEVNVSICVGRFTSIIGPSGCGKTTLLNILAGIIDPSSGKIQKNKEKISPNELSAGYVFQEPRLLDWKTVGENIKFALKARNVDQSVWDSRTKKYLNMVDLYSDVDTYPTNLSGGMKQRVAIARALAVEPEILLMDEPFSSLDEITARDLREELLSIWKTEGTTVVFVTHDIHEAVYLSDSIYVLNEDGEMIKKRDINITRPRKYDDPKIASLEGEIYKEFQKRATDD